MLQEQNARKGFFERQEFERLRTMLPQTYRAVVTFAYYSGWRKQEILGLAWDSSSGFATTGIKSSVVSKNNAGSMGTPSGHHRRHPYWAECGWLNGNLNMLVVKSGRQRPTPPTA